MQKKQAFTYFTKEGDISFVFVVFKNVPNTCKTSINSVLYITVLLLKMEFSFSNQVYFKWYRE